ncbi:MAG: DUF1289 domain-containing protein [Spirochaetaceae bacterium]|nr:DUF1289 domain-containing protein [Spirochaetaceae bacterium]
MSDDRKLSPCKRICVLSSDRSHCTACLRTVEEITNWASFATETKQRIMDELPLRESPKEKDSRSDRTP